MYDDLNRLIAVINEVGDAAVYRYDAVGNLLAIERLSAGQVSVLNFTPKRGPVGTVVTISGTGFRPTPSENTVTFNGVAASVSAATTASLVVTVPPGATTGSITVTTLAGSATSAEPFTVTASPPPTIATFAPAIGTPGTAVTITGTNFQASPSPNTVRFNGTVAAVDSAAPSTVVTRVPAGATSGKISVSTFAGTATSATDFIVPPAGFTAAQVELIDRMLIGQTRSLTITGTNRIGLLLFDGTAGQRVSLTASNSTFAGSITILNPDGTTLGTTGLGGGLGFIDTRVLPATGSYTIVVATTATVTITLYEVPPDLTGSITPGTPLTVTVTTPGQKAWLTFSGNAGQRMSLATSGATLYARVSILSSAGATVASTFTIGFNEGFIEPATLPASGPYTVFVDSLLSSTGLSALAGHVTLTLYDVPADVTGPITPGGAPVSVTFTAPGQNAEFFFDGTAGQRVSLNVTNVTVPLASVFFKRPDGSILTSTSAAPGGVFLDTATLPVTGPYRILVDPRLANIGSLTLTLYDVPADFSSAIAPGGPAVTVSIATPGQNARLSFTGTGGQRISLLFSNVTVANSFVTVLKPDGTTLTSAGVGTSGAFIDATAVPVTGAYAIQINPIGTSTGAMTVTLYDVPPDVTGALTVGGASLTVTLATPGQNARLSFDATVGQAITVRVANNSICLVTVRVLRPDNALLASFTACTSPGFTLFTSPSLPATGPYSITVDPVSQATGSLTVSVTSP